MFSKVELGNHSLFNGKLIGEANGARIDFVNLEYVGFSFTFAFCRLYLLPILNNLVYVNECDAPSYRKRGIKSFGRMRVLCI